jgi:PAS domain S-box-containing protein
MLRFFRNLSLSVKFLIFTTLVLLVIFGGLSWWIYSTDKDMAIEQADSRMYSQLEDLTTLLELEYRARQQEVDKALKVASSRIKALGEITETNEKIQMVAVSQATKSQRVVEVKKWNAGNVFLQENTKIVDEVSSLTNSGVAIFQKIPEGFMRIATTEVNPVNNKRFEGLFIPAGSPIVQTIERGQVYRGRVEFNNEYYIVAYEPIKIEGEIKGMLYTGVREKDVTYLRKKFKEKKYYTSGYPFAMSLQSNDYLIHPIFEGKSADKQFLEYAQKNKRGKYRFRYPNNDEGVWKWTYFTYYEPFELIVGATIDEAQLLDNVLNNVRNTLFVSFVIAFFVYLMGIGLISSYITRAINKIVEKLKIMTEGRRSEKMEVNSEDEIGVMAESLNKLIDGLESYKQFAQNIGHGNLQASFEPLSQEDELGNSLLEMRDSLQSVAQKEKKEKWLTEGFTQFADVLRRNNDNIHALCLEIITNLVKKLNANQGGIFLLQKDDKTESEEGYLEMMACYAYDRQKMMKKRVKIGEGLLGQSFQEADTLNIREIPDDYIHITSGLGEANPSNILIVPLKTNEITLGVVEIASFEVFDDLSVEFVEKISESIAVTLFTVTNNLRTKALLKESRELTQQMREKEEEMRQNMEELEATQEEMSRNEKETKRILLEAKNQKELMDALIDSTEDFIVALDKDYKITAFNIVARNWYQEKTYNKITIGVNLLSIVPLEQRETFKENYSRALLGERFIVEEKIDGEIYEYRYNPIQDEQGKAAGVSIFGRNITERKQLEQSLRMAMVELQESEEQVREELKKFQESQEEVKRKLLALEQYDKAIVESNIAKVELSLDGFITGTNAAFCNLLQYEPNEIVGKPHKAFLDEETASSPEYLNFWRNLRVGIAQTGEQKRLDKYGQEVWLWATYSPVKNKDGKVTSIIKLATDITPYKLKEQSLQARIEKLQKEIDKLKNNEQ